MSASVLRDGRPLAVRVLGSQEVTVDGEPVRVGAPRQQALLALLAAEAGRAVSGAALADRLWDGRPPPAHRSSLHSAVSRLRAVLERPGRPPLVRTAPDGGYLLDVPGPCVDALAFERLVLRAQAHRRRGEPVAAGSAAEEALRLWQGKAYASTPLAHLQEEAARLAELRVTAVEVHAEAALAAGAHVELVPRLAAEVARAPLHEPLRAALVLALYRAGRQADALRVCAEGARRLADELGVDPGPELQALHLAVLRQDPALAPGTRRAGATGAVPGAAAPAAGAAGPGRAGAGRPPRPCPGTRRPGGPARRRTRAYR